MKKINLILAVAAMVLALPVTVKASNLEDCKHQFDESKTVNTSTEYSAGQIIKECELCEVTYFEDVPVTGEEGQPSTSNYIINIDCDKCGARLTYGYVAMAKPILSEDGSKFEFEQKSDYNILCKNCQPKKENTIATVAWMATGFVWTAMAVIGICILIEKKFPKKKIENTEKKEENNNEEINSNYNLNNSNNITG